ncbi:MAG: Ig-like domain-containing protein [Syntrophales bacterium]
MIKKRSSAMLVTLGILGMILMNGCGAGTSGDIPAPPPGQTVAASIDLLVSNPQLNSDGATTVTLTAIVKDSNNRALSGKDVSFAADSGVLAVTKGTTGDDGAATATLGTGGNPANRPINLTAATGSVSATNTVSVTGTNISISGAASLSFGDSTPLTIFLKDAAGAGIGGKTVAVTSQLGNTLSAASGVTNLSGQVTVNVTGTVGGADKITASAIGATKGFDLTVNTTILAFVTPAPPPATVMEIPIGTDQPVTVEYISGTTPQAGVAVNFVTTRGALSSSVATTGADGRATVSVSSTNSGPALLVAFVAGGPTAQITAEYVATTASKLDLKASPATIGTNSGGATTEKSLLTATVRDANDNLVKNKTVAFTIVNDASAGSLSPASAITDSYGTANAYFIAGASPGGLGGVTIRAAVMGTTPAVTTTTTLTVAKKALFIALATGNAIKAGTAPNTYLKEYVALVTDSAGNPVVGATVVPTIIPMYYQKGFMTWGGTAWQPTVTLQPAFSTLPGIPACMNEDLITHNLLFDGNGVLDPGEDQNGNNRLDPGNVASVTATTTDATGQSTVSIVYAEDYAYWVNVRLEVFTSDLKGSTTSAFVTFWLEGAASDYTSQTIAPPGNPSPFGTSASCYVDLTVTPISASQITLTWQKSATANHYHVYRNGINIANATTNTYFDQGLTSGTQYCYQIRTVDAGGTESSFTNTVCNSTLVLPPSSLTATALSSTQIRISWAASPGATGYRIYRDGSSLPLKTVASTSTVDSELTPDTNYCYAVSSFNAAGESSKTSQVCAMTRSAGPPTPTGLNAKPSAGPPPKITVTWKTSLGATSYKVYRNGTLLQTTTGVQVIDTTVAVETQYCYTVSAVDGVGNESAQSNPECASVSTVTPPPPPTGVTATLLASPARVNLSWNASTGAVSYKIYRNGTFLRSSTAAPVTDSELIAATTYCYTVSAVDAGGNESAQSTSSACVTTP